MQLTFCEKASERKTAEMVVLAFWEDKKGPKRAFQGTEFDSILKPIFKTHDFKAKGEETLLFYPPKGKEARILLLGLGKEDGVTREQMRRAYAVALKVARKKKIKKLSVYFPDGSKLKEEERLEPMAEGLFLSNYAFGYLKKDGPESDSSGLIESIQFIGLKSSMFSTCKRVLHIAESVNFARDLINRNADDVTADTLTKEAIALTKQYSSIHVKALRKKELEKAKMGLLLAVNRAAVRDPALIILEYRGSEKSNEPTALVGKGITYDTGGLNLKPGSSMDTMKCDMSGAAAVMGVMRAAAELKLKCNLIGVIAAAENAIGPNSYKPGDVYVGHAGKSIEIADTDAEGRLVLADALSYLQKYYRPKKIIDIATLTGGISVALGEEAAGLFCNDDLLASRLISAGNKTFERLWRMPLFPEYKEKLKSSIADLKNSGGRKASSATAAAFLQEFISQNVQWAHIDIAGTAFISDFKPYHPTQATGMGVRLLIAYLEGEG